MANSRRALAAVLCMLVLFISYLHYSHIPAIESLHDIYRALYYLPVILAALLFGVRGAVLIYLLVLASYLPYLFKSWTYNYLFEADRLLHLSLQGILGLISGVLIDRDRRRRDQLERERYLAGLGRASTAIVHDLKNPLITIEGFARRLQNGKGDTAMATRTIIDSAAVMQSIVKDVLDFAKPIRLELSEVEISNVLKRAYDLCATRGEEKGVTIELKTSDLALKIMADSFQLIRAFENLLSNAIDASSEGQSVVVSASAEKNLIVVRIKDQGSGMDKETLKNIFIPFYTRKSSGTGLGMPIAKKIIEGHKGKILIKSQPARGTEVIVSLPAK